ncbi:MAG: MBL fold metallo-hydrolase [Oscillospiraceae bacterium]
MTVTWLGHACFALESGGYRLIIDPYESVQGYPALRAEAHAVYCSHEHSDHGCRAAVTLLPFSGPCPFAVTEVPSFHDEAQGAKRGENTIRVFEAEGLRVAHLGDLGHPLSQAQLAPLRGVDVLLLPVGGFYTIGPAEAKRTADAIGAGVTVPMHYRRGSLGFDVLAPVEDFLSLYPESRVRRLGGNSFTPERGGAGEVLLPAFIPQ